MMSKKTPLLLLLAIVASLLASCGSSKHTSAIPYQSKGGGRADTRTFEMPKSLPPQSNALLDEARRWLGTPYKYGGEDKRGVDCSGLVINVYRSALDIKLPRSSSEQARYCSPLQKNQLMPGDLIFFATGSSKTVSHVGIYVGDGRMIHSSTSGGVVVSDIESDYYVRTYAGAGSVDKYRAMISKSSAKSTSKPSPKTPASSGLASSGQKTPPAQQPSTAPAGEALPYKMTPVTSLPQKSTTPVTTNNQPAPAVVSETATPVPAVKSNRTVATVTATPIRESKPATKATVPTVSAESPKAKAEPTADEARKAVLNSLIEQKIDSILNK